MFLPSDVPRINSGSLQRALLVVLAVLVEEISCQRQELVDIDHHGEALGIVLPDERIDDAEGLARTGRTKDNGGTEEVDDVDPAVVQLFLVVIDHRDVDAVLVLFLVTALLERLVFEVPFVIANLCVEVFSNSVKALVDQHDARHQPNGDSRS